MKRNPLSTSTREGLIAGGDPQVRQCPRSTASYTHCKQFEEGITSHSRHTWQFAKITLRQTNSLSPRSLWTPPRTKFLPVYCLRTPTDLLSSFFRSSITSLSLPLGNSIAQPISRTFASDYCSIRLALSLMALPAGSGPTGRRLMSGNLAQPRQVPGTHCQTPALGPAPKWGPGSIKNLSVISEI